MIDLPANADVNCSDGAAGIFVYAINNPTNHQISHLVVQNDLPPHYEYLVPFELVDETTPSLITLKCTLEEFQQMPLFELEEFVPTEMPDNLSWPYYIPIPNAVLQEVDYISVEHQKFPLGEQVVHHGAQVEATDGPIGQIDELLIDSENKQVTHLVLREKHIFEQKEITIPVSLVDHIYEDTVYLKVNRQSLESLPTTPIQ